MKKLIGGIALAAALVVFAVPASAQLHENVVYPAFTGTGVTISGDWAMGINDDAKILGESPMYAGGRIQLGLPMFGVWAGAGVAPLGIDGVDSEFGFGGGAGFHVLNAPMTPVKVSIQAGAGYVSSEGESILNIPFGALIEIAVPTEGVGVTPWIYPRGQWVNFSPDVGDSESEFGYGASGGVKVTLPMGFGFQASLDYMSIKFGDSDRVNMLTLGAGLHYAIQVPSLGM